MTNTPPNAVDMEAYLLGCLLYKNQYLPDDLTIADFFEPKHQDIARMLWALKEKQIKPDEITVYNEAVLQKLQVQQHYLDELTKNVGDRDINQSWIDYIKRTSKLRRIREHAKNLLDHASQSSADPEHLLSFAEGGLKQFDRKSKIPAQLMSLESLEQFDRTNDPNCVLGRWLCKGGSLLIVGQSGTGKSLLMMQSAISWAVGRSFFGIRTKRSLRSLIIQAENDGGDVAESMQDSIKGIGLTPTERETLKENLFIYRDTVSTGDSFLRLLKDLILKHSIDIVYCDPLLSFAGINLNEQQEVSQFLRQGLSPILMDTGAILVAMHHTGKPKSAKDREGLTIADMAYSGLGSSEFTNYFREVAVLARVPGDEPIYKFGLTKRRYRAYLSDENGDFAGEIEIRHSRKPDTICWEYNKDSVRELANAHSAIAKVSPSPYI